jgi:hypothetical protein
MDTIIVGFSTPKSFNLFSLLIRTVGKSSFSHAYIRYYDTYTNKWIIYQASGRLVNMITADNFDTVEDIKAEFEIPVSDDTKLKTIQWAQNKLGTPYGVMNIVGIGCVLVARFFGKKITNPFADGQKTMVCSELVDYIMEDIFQLGDVYDPATAMPIDDYNFLESKGFKRLI